MTYTSLFFLFFFFPIVIGLYWLFFGKTRLNNVYLFIASLLFYAFGSLYSLFILCFLLLWNYVCALQISRTKSKKRRRNELITCLALNLLVLFMYKYLPGMVSANYAQTLNNAGYFMPVGLSFYLFSMMSYLFDVYRKDAPVEKNFIRFGVFAACFAWVNMGPIQNWKGMHEQIKNHPVTRQRQNDGALLFFQGLFMKVLIADNMAMVFSALAGDASWLGNLLYGFSYFFQLYFDFAGYSRMARGTASFFGFEVPKNFDKPYCALSVSDFWRRWHISLTSWFRQYVYIPLGGNRVSQTRWILNVLAVWLLTGIWHGGGWTFIAWGLYQAFWLISERTWLKKPLDLCPGWLKHVLVILSQLIGWTLFCSAGIGAAFGVIGRYFGIGINGFASSNALFVLGQSLLLFVCAAFASSRLPEVCSAGFGRIFKGSWNLVQTICYVCCFGLCIAFLVSATSLTFLYAAF